MPLIDGPTVHAVTDTRILEHPGFLERAETVFLALGTGGAVHLRGIGNGGSRLLFLARALRAFQVRTGCHLIINDRADIALAAGAWGVQLPARSLHPSEVRRIGPSLKIGLSVHSPGDAAAAAGADWVVAGNVYETPTHPGRAARGAGYIKEVAAAGYPVVAIGGILPANVPELIDAGAQGIAAIRGIWAAPDPGKAAGEYLEMIRESTRGGTRGHETGPRGR